MSGTIKVVGTGPGDPAYICPLALEYINNAEVLVGGQRLLNVFARPHQIQIPIKKDLSGIVSYIQAEHNQKNIVVMVSGDTGLFSLADYLAKHIGPDKLEFIPGISSIQLMFARLKRPWQEAQIVSMHGRDCGFLPELVKAAPITAVLTGSPWTVQKIAAFLIARDLDLPTVVGIDLSYPQERLIYSSLRTLAADDNDYNNCVMVIFNE